MAQEKGFNFDDARLMRGAWRNEPNPDLCKVEIFFDWRHRVLFLLLTSID